MKKPIFKVYFALMVSLFFVLTTGCSSDSTSNNDTGTDVVADETTEPVVDEDIEDNTSMQENQEGMMEENDQAANIPARGQIQPPQDKEPVLTAMSTSYQDWNTDGNSFLDKEEFYQGLYEVWDGDNNNEIGENEFTEGANNFFADYNFNEYGEFSDWDTDGNGNLSVQEFREGMKSTVDQEPVAQDLLVIWDTDNDPKIERIELDNITVRLDEDSN